jgi:trigger factor
VIDAYARNPRLVAGVEAMVLEEQAIDAMLEKADVKAKPMSFDDIMNPNTDED